MGFARQRARTNELKCEIGEQATTFGPPEPLVFGGSGSIGTSTAFSRADHIHAVPNLPRLTTKLDTEFFYFWEAVNAGSPTDYIKGGAAGRAAELDIPGTAGALGSLGPQVSVGNLQTSSYVAADGNVGTNTTRELHSCQRLRGGFFRTRVRPGNTGAVNLAMAQSPRDHTVAVGGILSTNDGLLDTITDGLYFIVTYASTSTTGWRCAAAKDGNITEKVIFSGGYETQGTAPTITAFFQALSIELNEDGTEATYVFVDKDGVNYTETIDTNIPQDADKVCGWGAHIDRDSATVNPSAIVMDYIWIAGVR